MRTTAQVAKSGVTALTGFTGRSTRYDAGSVGIRVSSVLAHHATECRLVGPILLGDVSALRAFARGVSGINQDQRDSRQLRFVFQKETKLRKRPTVENYSLLAPNRDPVADATKLFQLDTAPRAFSASNDLFTYNVIRVTSEPLLLARQFLQAPLGRASLLLLQLCPQPAMPETNGLRFGTTMALPVRVRSNIRYAKIHTQELGRFNRRIGRKVNRTQQIELAFAVDQIGLPLDAVEALPLVLTVNHGNDHALIRERPQTNLIDAFEAHDALIVGDRTRRLKDRAFLLVARKAFNCFANRANRHLRRKAKTRTNFRVGQLVDRGLAKYASIKPATCREGRGLVTALHRSQQAFRLFGIRQQLQLQGQFQYLGAYHSATRKTMGVRGKNTAANAAVLSLRRLNAAVSRTL
jgi:hypothetical protein